jgi:hypothetical protein
MREKLAARLGRPDGSPLGVRPEGNGAEVAHEISR